eukprot:1273193-Alexandrium_andersonii.AAC.1
MSASLVGSEMCIRDSQLAAKGNDHTRSRYRAARLPRYHFAIRWAPAISVSYTHLTLPTICSV